MKPNRTVLRRLAVAAAIVLLFTVVGVFVLPPIVRTQIERRASDTLGRKVTLERVRINPYALSVTLENLAVHERDGTSPFVGWRRLHVNFEPLASLLGEWVLGTVELEGFDARVRIHPDGTFNFTDILGRLAPEAGSTSVKSPPAKPPRPVRIASLRVGNARVEFSDQSRPLPFSTVVGPVTFSVSEFRTASHQDAPYGFEAVTESGEAFSWSGTLQTSPAGSTGEFRITNLALPKYAPYYADRIQADVAAGTLSIHGRYVADLGGESPKMILSEGAVEVRGLSVIERESREPILDLPALDVNGIDADATAMKAAIRSVALAGGGVRVRREKDGSINLIAALQPPTATTPPESPAATPEPAAKPGITIAEVAVTGFRIDVSDNVPPLPAKLALNDVHVSLKDVTLEAGARMPLSLGFAWAPEGTVRVEGDVALFPPSAQLKAEVSGLALLPLSPYVEQNVAARLAGGTFSATLDTRLDLPSGAPPAATVTGNVALGKLALVDAKRSEELAGFERLTLGGLRAGTDPGVFLALDQITLEGPYARITLNEDKSLNLAAAGSAAQPDAAVQGPAEAAPSAETPPTPASEPSKKPRIEIGKIVISEGDFRFSDRSIEPQVRMEVSPFGGTIAGLSSENVARADVDLKAMVDGSGLVSISGRLDPLGARKFVDLKIDFRNVDLLPLSPYSGRYAGYELARGKLLLDVKVLVDDTKIDASNVITLNQFTFGGPVKSPDATKLPVRLGVALLKDTEGKIIIDVPVQGSLDDPSFRVGRVVLRVIVNLLTKAAVSPFSLLGAAFGGGGDELAFQEFSPGSAELQPIEIKKLETVTRALTNRPGLNLNLEGSCDTAADTHALKRIKLADRVRRSVWEAKRQSDPNIPSPENLEIGAEEHAMALKKLYDEAFPPGTEFGAPVPPPPQVVTPPAPPEGIIRKIGRAITFRARKDRELADAENARLAAEHEAAMAAALATGLPVEEMTGRLAEIVVIEEGDLRELAHARARQVRDYLTSVGGIDPERIFLAKAAAGEVPAESAPFSGKGPRVFLNLE